MSMYTGVSHNTYLYSLQEVFNLCQQGPEVTEEGGGAVVAVKEICHLLDLFPVLGEL